MARESAAFQIKFWEKKMKQRKLFTLSLILILSLVIGLLGCTSTTISTPPQTSSPQASSPKPSQTSTPSSSVPSSSPAQAQVIKWKAQSGFTPGPPLGPIPRSGNTQMEAWAEWINKASGGRLVVEVAPPASLFPVAETFNAISKGVTQVASVFGGYYAGTLPEAEVEAFLPFAWETLEEAYVVQYRYGLADELKKIYAQHNIFHTPVIAAKYVSFGTNFPILTPDAIKGKKLRSTGSYAEVVSIFGGNPVNIPWGDMYMAIKLGTVDGYVGGIGALEEVKLKEVLTHYVIKPTFGLVAGNIMINMDAFNKLPDDIKEMIKRDSKLVNLAEECEYMMADEWIVRNTPNVKMVEWTPDEIAKIRKSAIEKIWPAIAAKSPGNKKLVDIFMRFAKDYGKI